MKALWPTGHYVRRLVGLLFACLYMPSVPRAVWLWWLAVLSRLRLLFRFPRGVVQ